MFNAKANWCLEPTPPHRLTRGYSALSPVLSTNVVYVKTQQKHARIKHHDRTKQ